MAEIIKIVITDDIVLFELFEKYGQELINTHFANINCDEQFKKIADEVIYTSLYVI
jgi:3-dehydroquinate synthase